MGLALGWLTMSELETHAHPTQPTDLHDATPRSSMSRPMVEITNRRYRNDPFWAPPKGVNYGLLVGAMPIQQPGLYPDQGSTYFVAQFHLPEGAHLTLHGEYGHLRYFSFTVAAQLGDGQLGNGDFLRDVEIEPEPGSTNPFRGEARDGSERKFTLKLVQGEPPAEKRLRPPNTLYTSSDSESAPIHLALRNYIPDVGYDGTGNVPLREVEGYGLPTVRLHLPGGVVLEGEAMAELLRVSKAAEARGYTPAAWRKLVDGSADPVNAPAQPSPAFQRFWNTNYSVTGSFVTDPLVRVQEYPADDSGGLANNPDTIYMMAGFSLYFGRVVVIRGKMPSHPDTRHREATPLGDTQVRYWSITTGGSVASGAGWQSLYDEEVPLDEQGNYTIVMSWPEDRPKNATKANGVMWIDFGEGEGHYVGARNWVNVVYMRYMNPNPDWRESPAKIPVPTPAHPYPQDAEVMKEYYPRAVYMSKADFEALY
jgi:hypothetical protein